MLKQIGGFVAWFSGSVAGISALLYALGFVATKAADQVLGVGIDFTSRDAVAYVARGGSVVMRTALISVWSALGVLAVAALIRWFWARSGLEGRASVARLRPSAEAVAPPAAALAMIAVSIIGLARYVVPALGVEGLLFASLAPAEVCAREPGLQRAILTQNAEALQDFFSVFALCIGAVIGLGLLARQALMAPDRRSWAVLAGLALFLGLLGAPIGYGALVLEAAAPPVAIRPETAGEPGRMRLISRADNGILIWLEDRRKLRWIKAEKVDMLTVGRSQPIVTISCPETEPAPAPQGGGE